MLCDRLRILIEKLDITQNKFAESLSVASGNMSNYLSGKQKPSKQLLRLIEEKYNVNPDWLEHGKEVESIFMTELAAYKRKAHLLIDQMDEYQAKMAYDYLQYIIERHKNNN